MYGLGEQKMKTIEEITNTIKLHHIASRRGYISRKSAGKGESYKGKFGEGYIILRPRALNLIQIGHILSPWRCTKVKLLFISPST